MDFERGSNPGNASPGTLVFTLESGTTIPGDCPDNPQKGQSIPGIPLEPRRRSAESGGLDVFVLDRHNDDYDDAFLLVLRWAVPLPECGDQLDNDGDGFTDFVGADPGCTASDDWSEKKRSVPLLGVRRR